MQSQGISGTSFRAWLAEMSGSKNELVVKNVS